MDAEVLVKPETRSTSRPFGERQFEVTDAHVHLSNKVLACFRPKLVVCFEAAQQLLSSPSLAHVLCMRPSGTRTGVRGSGFPDAQGTWSSVLSEYAYKQ